MRSCCLSRLLDTLLPMQVDMIIAGDGANSRVAKEIDAGECDYAIAFQERIRISDEKMKYYENLAEMYVGDDVSPDFYGWVSALLVDACEQQMPQGISRYGLRGGYCCADQQTEVRSDGSAQRKRSLCRSRGVVPPVR
jgi:hypothetical protein